MLNPGTKLGPYEVVVPLGAGGMGEVYRARDTRLGRDVALKVLPEAYTRDPQRMARFEREAKVLASLNHANIASIYGLEESGTSRALVMELVEGPTLADRIKQGPIPLEEALPMAKQVAEALEYAHERGIIHRDLKPANVKVTPEGQVKVLDFGLAKALEAETSEEEVQNSPTLSAAATQEGVLLGTAAYMSPEQARGKRADRRADIWAFGCVLYEMLTGKHAFIGESISDTLAAVIRAEPDWASLRPTRHPQFARSCTAACKKTSGNGCKPSAKLASPSKKSFPVHRPQRPPLVLCQQLSWRQGGGPCSRWDLFSGRSVLDSSPGIYALRPSGARSAASHSSSPSLRGNRLRREVSH